MSFSKWCQVCRIEQYSTDGSGQLTCDLRLWNSWDIYRPAERGLQFLRRVAFIEQAHSLRSDAPRQTPRTACGH
jgi:hypothetical protein